MTINMGTMHTEEKIEKIGADFADLLVESLPRSISVEEYLTKKGGAKKHVRRSGKAAGLKQRPGKRQAVIIRMPDGGNEVSRVVLSAIDDLERAHPGHRVAFLDKSTMALVTQIRDHLPEVRDAKSQEYIKKLIDVFADISDPLAEPRRKIDKDNADLRIKFIREVDTLSASDVSELANRETANPHNLASRWKSAKKIFAVDWQGVNRFPTFQFEHGKPKKVIGAVLEIFDGALGPWETAFWFVSSNKWLDGKSPAESLEDADALTQAAYSTVGEHYG